MAITKIVYVDGVTVIRAAQLNAWQDELIRLDDVKYEKPADGIPKSDLAAALQTLLDKAKDVEEAAERGDFDGEDGVSPTITVEEITGGHRVTITSKAHPEGQTFDVLDGEDGEDGSPGTPGAPGVSPTITVEEITGGHRVTITDATGTRSFDVMDGEGGGGGGTPGQDGYSPVVTITEITGGHRVTITSKAHPEGQTFDVLDGDDGKDGAAGSPGSAGADGVSPEISITNITGGHRVTITDEDHPQGQSFDVLDGEDGSPGAQGAPGVSPEVSVETITGGHRVTITDASGTRSFDVMDGQDAAQETKIQISLSASWTGSGPYTQTVTVSGGTVNSKVSLQPDDAQIAQLIANGVKALRVDNNNGTFTAHAVGAAPSTALTLQATRVEVTT